MQAVNTIVTVDRDGNIGLKFDRRVRSVLLDDPIRVADAIYEQFRRARACGVEEASSDPGE